MLRKLTPFLIAMVLGAVPAIADEIIHFTNGTSMPVVSHAIDGDMITVDLGDDAMMSFPIEQVDRIENATGDVPIRKSTTGNRIVPRPTVHKQQGVVPPRHRRGTWEASQDQAEAARGPLIERDERGVATYRPYANSGHAGKSRLRASGHRNVFNQPVATSSRGGMIGAKAVGTRYVLPSTSGVSSGKAGRPAPVGMTKKETAGDSGGDEKK